MSKILFNSPAKSLLKKLYWSMAVIFRWRISYPNSIPNFFSKFLILVSPSLQIRNKSCNMVKNRQNLLCSTDGRNQNWSMLHRMSLSQYFERHSSSTSHNVCVEWLKPIFQNVGEKIELTEFCSDIKFYLKHVRTEVMWKSILGLWGVRVATSLAYVLYFTASSFVFEELSSVLSMTWNLVLQKIPC